MNWDKARDWEVQEAAQRGWPEALAELKQRGLSMLPPRKGDHDGYWTLKRRSEEGDND